MITATNPSPGWWVVVVTGAFALLVAVSSSVLYNINVLGTLVHEAGHAAASVLTGGGVYRIEITGPDTGNTQGWGEPGFSSIATTAAGYATPALAGLGAASLLDRGHAPAVLAVTVALTLLVLLVTRDGVTLVCVLTVGALAFAALYWGAAWLQTWVACAEAWLLLTSEIGSLCGMAMGRFRGNWDPGDDAHNLAVQTSIPALVWIAGWFAVIGWAVWNAARLLDRRRHRLRDSSKSPSGV
ncbi:MAG: M50 family metallopeptidase [Actinobacteria bacterium]|nr:M50 family metallopeptidase [Actinomycetota bacterium]